MRNAETIPLVPVDEGFEYCCAGIQTAMPARLPLGQRIPVGTTTRHSETLRLVHSLIQSV